MPMSTLTQEQMKQNIEAMEKQGAKPAEIQEYLNSLASKPQSQPTAQAAPQEQGSWYGDAGRAIIKPVMRAASSFAPMAESIYAGLENLDGSNDFTKEDIERRNIEGRDFGAFGKDIKPLGWQGSAVNSGEMGAVEATGRMAADYTGTLLEIGSYGLAPLKAGMGFWGATRAATKAGSVYGASQAGQEAGKDNATAGDIAMTGLTNTVGAAAGFGLLNVGGQLMRNYGAKLLQEPSVVAAAKETKALADKSYTILGKAFQGGSEMVDDMTNRSLSRAYNSLKTEFNTLWKKTTDSVVDGLIPQVSQPALAQNKFHRALSKTMGTLFRSSDDAYSRVKGDGTQLSNFTISNKTLTDAGKNAVDLDSLTPGSEPYKKAVADMLGNADESKLIDSFVGEMKDEMSKPQTLGSVMSMWERSMAYLPHASNSEKKVIRDFANGLFDDAAENLKKTNPALLDDWNIAWESWGTASKIWDSSILQKLRAPGTTDTVVDDILKGKMNPAERDIIDSVLSNPETRDGFVDVVIGSVLRKMKNEPREKGVAIVEDFIQRWGKHLTPEQTQIMDNLGAFTQGNFDEFLGGIGKELGLEDDAMRMLKGLSGDTSQQLFDQSGKLDIGRFIEKGDFGSIADGMFDLFKKNPKQVQAVVDNLTPQEKQVIGLSLSRRIHDEGLDVISKNADGTINVDKPMVDAVVKTWDDISKAIQKSKSDDLYGMFTAEQLKAMENAAMSARNFNAVVGGAPIGAGRRFINAVATVGYSFARMFGSAANAAGRTLKPSPVTKKEYFRAINELMESGALEKNGVIKMADIYDILKVSVPQGLDQEDDAEPEQR